LLENNKIYIYIEKEKNTRLKQKKNTEQMQWNELINKTAKDTQPKGSRIRPKGSSIWPKGSRMMPPPGFQI